MEFLGGIVNTNDPSVIFPGRPEKQQTDREKIPQGLSVASNTEGQPCLPRNSTPGPERQSLDAYAISIEAKAALSLPLPSLDNLLNTLKAMKSTAINEQDFKVFLGELESFVLNEGEYLQEHLRKDAIKDGDWLSILWDQTYLESRIPTPINVSFGMQLNSAACNDSDQILQPMATAILAAYGHCQAVQSESLPVDKEKGKPLCMNQVKRLFNNRKPGTGLDTLQPCKPGKAQHIIVLSKGQIHKLSIANQEGSTISQARLTEQLTTQQQTSESPWAIDLTPLTAVDRNKCAELQDKFVRIEKNRNLLEEIDNAFCCVCLDCPPGTKPEDNSISRQLLTGDGYNRWFDKTLQFIQLPEGGVGATIEHTPADAGPWVTLFERINDRLKSTPSSGAELLSESEPLIPVIDDQFKGEIERARGSFVKAISQVQLKDIIIEEVGRDHIIKEFNISPDAFYQMVFQVAASKAGYSDSPVYESVSMRHFSFGRTEGLRSRSPEVTALINALKDKPSLKEQNRVLLMQAIEAHSKNIKKCKAGQGVCRYLLALEKKWEALHQNDGAKKPEFFTNPVYRDLIKKNTLSTSCVANENIRRFVFGPVEQDGLGIPYYPTADKLRVTVSSRTEHAEKADPFVDSLESSVKELLDLLRLKKD